MKIVITVFTEPACKMPGRRLFRVKDHQIIPEKWRTKVWRWRMATSNGRPLGMAGGWWIGRAQCLRNLEMVTGIKIHDDDPDPVTGKPSRLARATLSLEREITTRVDLKKNGVITAKVERGL